MGDVKKIIVVSDGTGRTAKRLMDAVLSQYVGHESQFRVEGIHSSVRTIKALDKMESQLYPIVVSDIKMPDSRPPVARVDVRQNRRSSLA